MYLAEIVCTWWQNVNEGVRMLMQGDRGRGLEQLPVEGRQNSHIIVWSGGRAHNSSVLIHSLEKLADDERDALDPFNLKSKRFISSEIVLPGEPIGLTSSCAWRYSFFKLRCSSLMYSSWTSRNSNCCCNFLYFENRSSKSEFLPEWSISCDAVGALPAVRSSDFSSILIPISSIVSQISCISGISNFKIFASASALCCVVCWCRMIKQILLSKLCGTFDRNLSPNLFP